MRGAFDNQLFSARTRGEQKTKLSPARLEIDWAMLVPPNYCITQVAQLACGKAPPMLFAPKFAKEREKLRREHVRELFVARSPMTRTANDVLDFFLWLRQCGPDLLQSKQGDAYQRLKVDLDGLYLKE